MIKTRAELAGAQSFALSATTDWRQRCLDLLTRSPYGCPARRLAAGSLVKRVKEIHPYATPEVIVIPIVAGSDAYLQWVAGSTKSAA